LSPPRTALISCVPGDEHELVPLALSIYLESRGWAVKNLGGSLPADQIARAAASIAPDTLFLTLTRLPQLDAALETVGKVRGNEGSRRIIFGAGERVKAREILERGGAPPWPWDFDQGYRLALEGRQVRSLAAVSHGHARPCLHGGSLLGVWLLFSWSVQQLSILFGLLNYMSVLVDHSGADAWITSANLRNADAGNLISGRFIDRIIGLPGSGVGRAGADRQRPVPDTGRLVRIGAGGGNAEAPAGGGRGALRMPMSGRFWRLSP